MSCITNRALACYGIAKLLGSVISGTIVTQRTGCCCAVTMDTIQDTIGDVMTACTRGIRTKVERMAAMALTGFIGMTGGTGVARTRCNYTGWIRRGVMLTVVTDITMTGCTTVIVMQLGDITPGADRSMTLTAAAAASCLVRNVVITYRMVRARSMDMAVKVTGGMTIGTGRKS